MKKIIALLMALSVLLSLAACQEAAQPAETTAEPTVEATVPVAPYADPTMPKKLTVAQVENLPLATADMSYADRRQLCIDFFRLQLSAQWLSNMDIPDYTRYTALSSKAIDQNTLYGGIPYCGSQATGNLYRWLEYYDQETGIFDMVTAVEENGGYGENANTDGIKYNSKGEQLFIKYRFMYHLFNHCTSSSTWAWGRVINSAKFGLTKDCTAYNGYIPVGCYSYGYEYEGKTYDMLTIDEFGVVTEGNPLGYDVKDVIADLKAERGENGLYDCYALLKPGDALLSGGHMIMVTAVNLFTTSDGQVDYEFSTISVAEQIDAWGVKGTEGDRTFRQQGWDDKSYTFAKLQESNYIPYTFAELLDPNNEQDKKHLDYFLSYRDKLTALQSCYTEFSYDPALITIDVEEAVVFCNHEGETITPAQLQNMVVGSNYSVSDVFVTVADQDGNQLLRNIHRSYDLHELEVPMTAPNSTYKTDEKGDLRNMCYGVADLAAGQYTVTITMQLSTGQLLTVYSGILTV